MARRGIPLWLVLASMLIVASSAQAATPVERQIQELFWAITWFAIGVAVTVFGALFIFLARYRQSVSTPPENPPHGNRRIEILWTVIPTVILVIISAISVPVLFFTDTVPNADTTIRVTAFQWAWRFEYEDGANQTGEVWFQEDVTVKFLVTSLDVIHSFALPQLGVKIDAIPGRETVAWARVDKPGTFITQCAEFCGVGHYGMRATVRVFAAGTQARIFGPPPETPKFMDIELREFGGNTTKPWSISPANLTFPIGARVRLRIWNNNSVRYDFRVDAPINASVGPINPFTYAELVFNVSAPSPTPVPYGPSDLSARDRGMIGTLVIQSGRVIVILLDEWFVSPDPARDPLGIEKGETVVFELRNVGDVGHNFTMGGIYGNVKYDRLIDPGEIVFVGPFTFDGDASGQYWCNVPGHKDLGMVAGYLVGAGGVRVEREVPVFEITIVTFVVGGVATFVYVVRHARRRDQ